MVSIYSIQSPNNSLYIGQTVNFVRRMYGHKNGSSFGRSNISNSIKKYGFLAHTIKVLHDLPEDVGQDILNEYEIFYINRYKECGFKMMNLREGGSKGKHLEESVRKIRAAKVGNKNMLGKKHSEESKKKMSESHLKQLHGKPHFNLGRKASPEKILKLSESHKGKKLSDEAKIKLREAARIANTGKIVSEETKAKLREINLGKKHSEETKLKLRNKVLSAETKMKISKRMINWHKNNPNPCVGTHRSLEARRKTSEKLKGRTSPMKGKRHSSDTILKMSKSRKEFLQNANK